MAELGPLAPSSGGGGAPSSTRALPGANPDTQWMRDFLNISASESELHLDSAYPGNASTGGNSASSARRETPGIGPAASAPHPLIHIPTSFQELDQQHHFQPHKYHTTEQLGTMSPAQLTNSAGLSGRTEVAIGSQDLQMVNGDSFDHVGCGGSGSGSMSSSGGGAMRSPYTSPEARKLHANFTFPMVVTENHPEPLLSVSDLLAGMVAGHLPSLSPPLMSLQQPLSSSLDGAFHMDLGTDVAGGPFDFSFSQSPEVNAGAPPGLDLLAVSQLSAPVQPGMFHLGSMPAAQPSYRLFGHSVPTLFPVAPLMAPMSPLVSAASHGPSSARYSLAMQQQPKQHHRPGPYDPPGSSWHHHHHHHHVNAGQGHAHVSPYFGSGSMPIHAAIVPPTSTPAGVNMEDVERLLAAPVPPSTTSTVPMTMLAKTLIMPITMPVVTAKVTPPVVTALPAHVQPNGTVVAAAAKAVATLPGKRGRSASASGPRRVLPAASANGGNAKARATSVDLGAVVHHGSAAAAAAAAAAASATVPSSLQLIAGMRGTKLHAHDEEPDESPSPTAKSPRRQPLSVKATAGAAKAALSTSPNQHLATAAADSSTSPTSPRKRKNIFPADKRAILLKYYQEVTKTPSRNQRQELVEQVGSNEKTIRIWFQNHRQKFAEMAKRSRKGGAQRELTASSTHGSMHNLANSSTHFMQTTPAPGGVAGAAGSMHSLYMGSSDSHIVYGPSPLPHMLAGPTSTPAGGTIIHPPPPQQMPVPHASFPGAAAAFAKVAMTHGHLHNGQPQQQFGPGTHPTTSAAGTPDRRMVTTIAGGSPPVAAYPPLPPYGMYSTGSVPEPGMQFNGGPGHPMHFQPMMQQQPRPHPYYQQQQQLQQGFARASPMMMMVPGAPMPQFGGSPVMTIMPNPMPPQTRQVNGGGLMYMPSSAATMPSALGLMSGTVLGGSGLPFSGMPPTTLFQVPLEKPAPTSSHGGSPQQSTRGADANPGGAANGFHI